MQQYPILGLDVSKQTLDACLVEASGDRSSVRVRNTSAGFTKLQAWLVSHSIGETLTVCLEATNVYSAAVTTFFYEQQATVYLVNPLQVASFMRTELRRVKTDKADAEAIARCAAAIAHRLRPWQPIPEQYQTLRDLVRQLHELTRSRARVKNRQEKTAYLTSSATTIIRKSLQAELAFYDRAIDAMHASIQACIDRHPDLHHRYGLLTSAPGIGPISAITLMAEVPDMQRFRSAKHLASYAGLTPRIRHSGVRHPSSQPISKIGNTRLRRTLYMAALTAKRCNPNVTGFAQRLTARDHKRPKVVTIAVARKLLHLLYAMEKHQTPFTPQQQKLQLTDGTI